MGVILAYLFTRQLWEFNEMTHVKHSEQGLSCKRSYTLVSPILFVPSLHYLGQSWNWPGVRSCLQGPRADVWKLRWIQFSLKELQPLIFLQHPGSFRVQFMPTFLMPSPALCSCLSACCFIHHSGKLLFIRQSPILCLPIGKLPWNSLIKGGNCENYVCSLYLHLMLCLANGF